MKKLNFKLALVIAILPTLLAAQETVITLNENLSGESHNVVARNTIFLKPGFKYTAAGTDSLWAHISLDTTLPPIIAVNCLDPSVPIVHDESLPVGAIPGQAGVSPTGAANYTIPIEVPPAAQGMQPKLSLVYSSQAGNGIMGVGWNLAGLSAITRVPKNIYNDGIVEEIKLDATDNFALDGNRLIVTDQANSEYHTEIETFVKVTAQGSSGSGPLWFKVETKDGLTIQFGNTEGSRVIGDNNNIIAWKINRIEDQHTNYMVFEYRTDDDEQPISKIKYGGNTNDSKEPFNTILFNYVTRNDINTTWPANKQIVTDLLLEDVEITSENSFVRKYEFGYECNLNSHLVSVTLTGSEGIALNKTYCDYGFGNKSFIKETKTISELYTNSYRFYYGDFNGDGKTDFISVPIKGSYTTSDKWRLYCANDQGDNFEFKYEGNLFDGFQTFYTGDFNGDGMDDLLMGYTGTAGWYYFVKLSTGASFINQPPAKTFDFENEIFITDFDGDGIDDYMVKRNDKVAGEKDWYIYSFGNNNNLNSSLQLKSSGNIASWGENVYERYGIYSLNNEHALDFNGNGKKELLIQDVGGYKIYEFGSTANLLFSGDTPNSWDGIYLGDYNGDGKTDMVYQDMSEDNFGMYYSNGEEFIESPTNFGTNSGYGIYQGDYNGDGKTDILTLLIEDGKIKFSFAYANANGNFDYEIKESGYNEANYLYVQPYLAAVQLNGDSYTDLIIPFCQLNQSNQLITYLVNPGYSNNLLSNVTDGFINTTEFNYKPITDNSIYTKGTNAEFPNYDYQGTSYVVNGMVVPNGVGNTSTSTFTYEGAKVHRQGRGFLGFSKSSATNNTTGKKTVSSYGLNNTYYYPYITTVQVFSNDILQGMSTSSPGIKEFGDKRIFPFVSENMSLDVVHGQTITNTTTFDEYGNPDTITVNYNGDATSQTINTYTSFSNSWCPKSRVQQSKVSNTRSGVPSLSATTDFAYNNNGTLTSKINFSGLDKAVTETYEGFDNFGNPQKITISAADLEPRETNLLYDGYGRFVTKQTNPLGHETSYTYDGKTGQLLSQTDVNGLLTTNEYDGFGRLEKITYPNLNTTTISRTFDINGTQLYYTTETTGGQPDRVTYYDILGRKIKSGEADFNGTMVYADTEYTPKGQLWKMSEPYSASATHYTTYKYFDDGNINDGRLEKITYPTTATETYIYETGSTETTITSSNGTSKTTISDGTGAVTSVEDEGGLITYTYFAHGGVKEVSYGANTIAMLYDDYGRQSSLTDPNAGTINYSYNAFGELESQTDARSNFYEMFYDKLGRLDRKELDGTTVADYTYYDNTATYGIGLLASVTGEGNNISYTYEYNGLSLLTKKTENFFNDRSFVTEYAYHPDYSYLNKITQPDGYIIDNEYQNAYLSTVKGTNLMVENIFTASTYNERGQISAYTLGNGLSTSRGYNDFGMPTSIATPGIQNLQYDFDILTGNLNWRKDELKGLQENFSYDAKLQNRLETWKVNTATDADTVLYANNGNIDWKSGLDSFKYESGRPHAVSEIANTGNIVSTELQDITYTPFNKVESIIEGDYKLEITYGPDNQRKKTILYELKGQNWKSRKTKYFVSGGYELELYGNQQQYEKHLNYIYGADGLTAIFEMDNNNPNLYYIHKDHLGSYQSITDNNGALADKLSFGPWGARRDTTDWSFTSVPNEFVFDRGFTGHEHLDEFNLINMNGRVYDPILGRFLSPDNYVQLPDYTQSLNRYAYAYNNPLIFTDPDGEFPFLAVGLFALFTYLNNAHSNRSQETGQWAWNPVDWFGEGSNTTIIAGVNTNTDFSSVGGYAGAGSGYHIPAVSYNSTYGPGVGYWSPQGSSFTYPGQDHNIAKRKVNEVIENVRETFGDVWRQGSEFLSDGIWTIGYTGTASPVYGLSFEAGITVDARKGVDIGLYFTLEETFGADLSQGGIVNYHKPRVGKEISVSNLNGWSESTNYAFLNIDGTYGGNALKPGLHPKNLADFHSQYYTYGIGGSVGSPIGFTINKGFTWTTKKRLSLWKK